MRFRRTCLLEAIKLLIDGCYTWLLWRALNVDRSDHVTNDTLYGVRNNSWHVFQIFIERLSHHLKRENTKENVKKYLTYGELPRLSNKLRSRRLQFAGHCFRAKDEAVSKVILWTPNHGQRSRGRPATTYVDLLTKDTGLQTEELATAMTERCEWRDACFRDLRDTH